MHVTVIKLKDGTELSGFMNMWRPCENWMSLMNLCLRHGPTKHFPNNRICFDDIESAVTKDVMMTINQTGDQDELARARRDLAQGRKYGWKGYPAEKFKWEG